MADDPTSVRAWPLCEKLPPRRHHPNWEIVFQIGDRWLYLSREFDFPNSFISWMLTDNTISPSFVHDNLGYQLKPHASRLSPVIADGYYAVTLPEGYKVFWQIRKNPEAFLVMVQL